MRTGEFHFQRGEGAEAMSIDIGVRAEAAPEATSTVAEIVVHFTDDQRPVDLAGLALPGGLHAVWGGRCIDVPATAFMRRVYALIGVTPTGEVSAGYRSLLDFDVAEGRKADRRFGLHAFCMAPDGSIIREVTLTVGEFWDLLHEIAQE